MLAAVEPIATLLVVDDEPDVREVLEEYFGTKGYTVFGAEDPGPHKFFTSTQTFTMDDKGTVTVTKGDASTSREAPPKPGWFD